MPEDFENEQNRIERLKPLVNYVASQLHNDGVSLRNIAVNEANLIILNAVNTAPELEKVVVRSQADEDKVIELVKKKLSQLSMTGSDFY